LVSSAIAGVDNQTRAGQSWTGAIFAAKVGFDGKLPVDVPLDPGDPASDIPAWMRPADPFACTVFGIGPAERRAGA